MCGQVAEQRLRLRLRLRLKTPDSDSVSRLRLQTQTQDSDSDSDSRLRLRRDKETDRKPYRCRRFRNALQRRCVDCGRRRFMHHGGANGFHRRVHFVELPHCKDVWCDLREIVSNLSACLAVWMSAPCFRAFFHCCRKSV
jgi:hypothetical protein